MTTPTEQLSVSVNGEPRTIPIGYTLPDLLEAEDIDPSFSRGIAVALNDEVVRKMDWKDVVLHAGDRVEIVTANAGG